MKKITFLLLFLSGFCFAQEQVNYKGFEQAVHQPERTFFLGTWKIDKLITNAVEKEYTFDQQDTTVYRYGNKITLNADQTFESYYTAPCRLDCFTRTRGNYKLVDENYICFLLKNITRFGTCQGDEQPAEDLGLYYFHVSDNGSILLLKSAGSLEQDKNNAMYREMILAKYQEMKQFGDLQPSSNLLLNWKETTSENLQEIVAHCMAEQHITDFEVLYTHNFIENSHNGAYLQTILVKTTNDFKYLVYHPGDKSVGMYNDLPIRERDSLVQTIDCTKKLKRKTFKETYHPQTSSSTKNTLTVYTEKKEVFKIVLNEYFSNGGSCILTVYLNHEAPIYITRELVNTTYNLKTAYYFLDATTQKIVTREIKKNYSDFTLAQLIKKYQQLLEETNKQLN